MLTSRTIQYVSIDMSAPGMEFQRDFMRRKGKRREGQRNVIPPQVFNGEEYRGDYEDFDVANEDDQLEEFLGLQRKNPKVNSEQQLKMEFCFVPGCACQDWNSRDNRWKISSWKT